MRERRFRSVQGVALALDAAGRLPAGAAEWRVPEGAQTARDLRAARLVAAEVRYPGEILDGPRRALVRAAEVHALPGLSDQVRAAAVAYGAMIEELSSPGAPSQLGVFVAGGRHGGGNAVDRRLEMQALVDAAAFVFADLPAMEPMRRARRPAGEMLDAGRPHRAAVGAGEIEDRRRPIGAAVVADLLCVRGATLSEILERHGWQVTTGTRARLRLYAGGVLQAMADAWNGAEARFAG